MCVGGRHTKKNCFFLAITSLRTLSLKIYGFDQWHCSSQNQKFWAIFTSLKDTLTFDYRMDRMSELDTEIRGRYTQIFTSVACFYSRFYQNFDIRENVW